jgi:hypothetical protein
MSTSIMKYKLMKNLSDRILLARMQLHACRFRLATKKNNNTEFVLQCSIFNFLTRVFGIKITKKSPGTKSTYLQILTGYFVS